MKTRKDEYEDEEELERLRGTFVSILISYAFDYLHNIFLPQHMKLIRRMVGDEGVVIAKRWKLRVGRRERKKVVMLKWSRVKENTGRKKNKELSRYSFSDVTHS